MKRSGKTLVFVVSSLALGASVMPANPQDNPYAGIAVRNLFALKPPPPPPPGPGELKPPPSKIILQGIIKILGSKRVMFTTRLPPKPGQQPKDTSFTLKEGQREEDIEVLEIDLVAESVTFNNRGKLETLFLKDAPQAPAGAPIPAFAGAPAPRVPGIPLPPGATAATTVPPEQRSIPPRALRLPGATTPNTGYPVPTPPNQPPPRPPRTLSTEEAQVLREVFQQSHGDQDGPPQPPQLPELPPE